MTACVPVSVLATVLLAATLAGQVPPTQLPRYTNPQPPGVTPGPGAASQPSLQIGFQGLSSVYPQWSGFPNYLRDRAPTGAFPSLLSPAAGGVTVPDPARTLPLPPRAAGDSDTWPSWIRFTEGGESVRRSASRAVLARTSDRVWVLEPGDDAFVPLAFYDKFRLVQKSTIVETRAEKAEYTLLMHDGAELRVHGPCHLTLTQLDEDAVEVALGEFHTLFWTGKTRALRLRLPDGSLLEAPSAELRIAAQAPFGTITSYRGLPARYRSRVGPVTLEPGHRVRFLLAAPEAAVAEASALVVSGGLVTARTGRVLEVRSEKGGTVGWSGARFTLPPGARLRLDPLAGAAFPENTNPLK